MNFLLSDPDPYHNYKDPQYWFNDFSTFESRFLDRVGDAGGGQYMVNYLHIIEEIAAATVENIVKEKFGSKSMRIFRYIREKRCVLPRFQWYNCT